MVALNRANIPASINTVEALAAWCAAVLTYLHFQDEIQEAPSVIQKVAVSQTFPIEINGAYQLRHIGRFSLPMRDLAIGTGKPWENVLPLSNAGVPTEFTA